MVPGVRVFSVTHCPGHSKPEALFQRAHRRSFLSVATLSTIALTLILPFTPLGVILGFNPLPISFLLLIGIIVSGYIISAEMAKTVFYRKVRSNPENRRA